MTTNGMTTSMTRHFANGTIVNAASYDPFQAYYWNYRSYIIQLQTDGHLNGACSSFTTHITSLLVKSSSTRQSTMKKGVGTSSNIDWTQYYFNYRNSAIDRRVNGPLNGGFSALVSCVTAILVKSTFAHHIYVVYRLSSAVVLIWRDIIKCTDDVE
jgi:hypothetical protein